MNVIQSTTCTLLAFYVQLTISLAPHELTFLIISQNYSVSANLANELKNNILHQIRIEAFLNNNEIESVQEPNIILSHETLNSVGSWAITPILASSPAYINNIILSQRNPTELPNIDLHNVSNNTEKPDATTSSSSSSSSSSAPSAIETKWLILCEDQSIVDLKALINNLKHEDYTKDIFLGYPLRDSEATIIHHFAFFQNPSWFLYPLFRAGVAISIPLFKKLAERIRNERIPSDFFIDASHELSLFAWNKGKGYKLTEAPYFCLERKSTKSTDTLHSSLPIQTFNDGNGCAIYSRNRDDGIYQNHLYSTDITAGTTRQSFKTSDITINQVFFAVKTCTKFHDDRIPIIQRTWAKETRHIRYYSDAIDSSIPTISTNIENTENGHCAKTLTILKMVWNEIHSNKHLKQIKFVVLSDDDTLFSVSTLLAYLRNFDASADIYLGERYGYQLLSSNGFNYITGGGGIVFSLSVIEKLVNSCQCPTLSSPDDMIIALCLQQTNVQPIHSSRFHQARPIDYPKEVLFYNQPISFHKFWQMDPYFVYEQWLHTDHTREKRKYHNGFDRINKQYCNENQNQNELSCHENSFDVNN